MRQTKSIALFVVTTLGLYALVLAARPLLQSGYGAALRATADFLFSDIGDHGASRFLDIQHKTSTADTHILVTNMSRRNASGNVPVAEMKVHSWWFGFLPLSLTCILILATPLPWRRRLQAIAWGILLIHVFIGVKVGLALLYLYNSMPALEMFVVGEPLKSVLMRFAKYTINPTPINFIAATAIWLLATFRRDDWRYFVKQVQSSISAPAQGQTKISTQ